MAARVSTLAIAAPLRSVRTTIVTRAALGILQDLIVIRGHGLPPEGLIGAREGFRCSR
jgi:hypothetical protein